MTASATLTGTHSSAWQQRPNVILISSDDQTDWELDYMAQTKALIADQGVNFVDGISPNPLCCPARAEILTGEYAHNNGVRYNTGPYGGYPAFLNNRPRNRHGNLGAWMQDAGYHTAFIGKMLNHYGERTKGYVFKPGDWRSDRRMPGWNYWSPTRKGTYSYVPGATEFVNNDGTSSWPDEYVADTVRDRTIHQIDKWAPSDKPFFIWASHVGPHGSIGMHVDHAPIPAAEYADWAPPGEPQDFTLPDSITSEPSFNEADVSDKVGPMQLPLQDPDVLDQRFRARVRSLQSIDDANAAIVNELAALGELDNTVIIFVSDNGFSLGQHRYFGKEVAWEEALQVPFLMRGPGITPGTVSTQTASMVDIAPTVLAYAGALTTVRRTGRTDGENLKAVLTRPGTNLSPTSLIQDGTAVPQALRRFGWTWRGVRTDRYTYARWWDGEEEFYDRQDDPYELTNLIDNTIPAPRFHKHLRDLANPARQQELQRVLNNLRWRYEQLKHCGRGKNQQPCERL